MEIISPLTAELTNRYPYIVAWHRFTRSYDYYIENQIDKAISLNLPRETIYINQDNTPALFNQIRNPNALEYVIKWVVDFEAKQ